MNYPRTNGLEMHHSMTMPCTGMVGRGPLPRMCQTLVVLPLDMGPSSFRCPVCKTMYIIDPLVVTDLATARQDFSVMEAEGHRIEIFFGRGEIAQRTHSDYEFAWSFLTPKIGSIDNAYIAEMRSPPGMGHEVLSQFGGVSQGPGSHFPPSVTQASSKRSQAPTWSRIALFLILILACVAAGTAIFMALGS